MATRNPGSRHDGAATYLRPAATTRRREPIELLAPREAPRRATALFHTVAAGDRLDLIAARYFGDPRQAWRIVDANPVAHPDELCQPGRRLRIPRTE